MSARRRDRSRIRFPGRRLIATIGDQAWLAPARRLFGKQVVCEGGPDFICFGQQKAGTTWLYDQLAAHPSFWMPPGKELHYFDSGLRAGAARSGMSSRPGELGVPDWRRVIDPRDLAFAEAAKRAEDTDFDMRLYCALFAMRGSLLSGDITPGYSTLRRGEVERIARALPNARFLLIVRDPVQRFWSMIRMLVANGKLDGRIARDWPALRAILGRRGIQGRSNGTELLTRWRGAAGRERVSLFFFDDIAARPAEVRREIIATLGGNPALASGVPVTYNRHTFDVRLDIPDTVQSALVAHFRGELRSSAELFGGPATEWPDRYGV